MGKGIFIGLLNVEKGTRDLGQVKCMNDEEGKVSLELKGEIYLSVIRPTMLYITK